VGLRPDKVPVKPREVPLKPDEVDARPDEGAARPDEVDARPDEGATTPDPHRRFRLTLQYDGSAFLGWQLQPGGRTVQGEVEAVLMRLTGIRRPVVAAGRTDRGVHAMGQVAAVTLPGRWRAVELQRAMNALLPRDIWVESVRPAPGDFHPRYHAVARSYRYQLGLSTSAHSPFHRPWCWPLEREVDPELLQRASTLIPGERSFKAFGKAGQEQRGDRCRVTEARWVPWEELGWAFHITADRFLHHMVRYLVGSMVEVARGRRPLEEIQLLLSDPNSRLVTSPPAPAQGLFLYRVHYPGSGSELD
jgi:tRNA pseudouridine38-40 synthase